MSEFVILIGGPGLFKSCDPKHDKIWLNYFYPMKVAAENDLYKKSGEQVHWLVYEPAYKSRWLDDDEITLLESTREFFSGSQLHKVRKGHAAGVSPSKSYLDYIRTCAKTLAITYHGLTSPGDFWTTIASFPVNSITRVWYCGHASANRLMLELQHDSNCSAVGPTPSSVLITSIKANASLKDRFVAGTTRSSEFYGCHTASFAQEWNAVFGVPAEGAEKSITFAKVLTSIRQKILDDMKTTPTPAEGVPNWTKYGVAAAGAGGR